MTDLDAVAFMPALRVIGNRTGNVTVIICAHGGGH